MTLGLDLQTIDAAVWARLVTDSAGATARALLGSSAAMTAISGVSFAAFKVGQLGRVAGASVPLMWAAFERGAVTGGARLDMRRIPFDWWCYGTDERALEGLGSALDALYSNQTMATGRITTDLITYPVWDDALALYGMRVRLAYSIYR